MLDGWGVGELGGTLSRGSSPHNPSQLSLVPSQPAGPGGWECGWGGRPGIGAGRGSGLTHFSQRDGVILSIPMGAGGHGAGLCSLPAEPSGLGTALPPPETLLAHPPHPSMGQGPEGDTEARGKCGGIGKAVGTGGWVAGCG